MRINVHLNKNGNTCIAFKDMTHGAALALCHALQAHSNTSPVCDDLRDVLQHSVRVADGWASSDWHQELFEALTSEVVENSVGDS
jgi:hypothetical protein